jgi:4-amino-4-deoxy-L-arabinose transferase-like glycosyltransferase
MAIFCFKKIFIFLVHMPFLKTRLFLLIVLAIFVACKIPYLQYSYYWDESWPYATAVTDMYRHGISLMPDAIDAEVSRGHPLFFHAAAALWMKVFGNSHVAMHSFALFISVLFLIAVYEAGLRLFNTRVAALALLMVATQEMFFVQSSMLLLEMLVAFLCFISLVFYVKEKYFLTALSLTLLFYTKESGLIMGFVLGADALMQLLRRDAPLKKSLLGILSVGVPVMLIGIFFLLQKHIRGWYIFPFYAGLVQHDWSKFWYSFRINCIRSEFYDFLKFRYFQLLALVAIAVAVKQKNARPLVILLPVVCIYYFIDDMRAGRLLPGIPFFIVFIGSVFSFLYVYASLEDYTRQQQRLIVLSGLFILCFLCFSATNFFTPRYLLASIIPLFFITAVFFDSLTRQINFWLYYPVAATAIVISIFAFKANDHAGDTDLGAYDAVEVQQKLADYFQKNVAYDASIGCGPFIERQHLIDPATGYLRGDTGYRHVKWDIDDRASYVLFDNVENDSRYDQVKSDAAFQRVFRAEKGKVWGEVYKRK